MFGAAPPNPEPIMVAGKTRSPHWPHERDLFLKTNGKCACCGATKLLNVHHKKPYHLFPELELVHDNFITLCESPTHNCHFILGHCLDWTAYNPRVEELVKILGECLRGKLSA